MPSVFPRWLLRLMLAACTSLMAAASHAAPLPQAEALAVRQVVMEQLDALATDDAQRLFETTTPQVRETYGSSGSFLAMMRGHYPMMYRPRGVTFQPAETFSRGAVQVVEITDQTGQRWLALFALEQQTDASWRISACRVEDNPWLAS